MSAEPAAMIRIVYCPKCRGRLQEPPNAPIYQCAQCDAILVAKKHRVKKQAPNLKDLRLSQRNEVGHIPGDAKATTLSSMEHRSLDGIDRMEQNVPDKTDREQFADTHLSNEASSTAEHTCHGSEGSSLPFSVDKVENKNIDIDCIDDGALETRGMDSMVASSQRSLGHNTLSDTISTSKPEPENLQEKATHGSGSVGARDRVESVMTLNQCSDLASTPNDFSESSTRGIAANSRRAVMEMQKFCSQETVVSQINELEHGYEDTGCNSSNRESTTGRNMDEAEQFHYLSNEASYSELTKHGNGKLSPLARMMSEVHESNDRDDESSASVTNDGVASKRERLVEKGHSWGSSLKSIDCMTCAEPVNPTHKLGDTVLHLSNSSATGSVKSIDCMKSVEPVNLTHEFGNTVQHLSNSSVARSIESIDCTNSVEPVNLTQELGNTGQHLSNYSAGSRTISSSDGGDDQILNHPKTSSSDEGADDQVPDQGLPQTLTSVVTSYAATEKRPSGDELPSVQNSIQEYHMQNEFSNPNYDAKSSGCDDHYQRTKIEGDEFQYAGSDSQAGYEFGSPLKLALDDHRYSPSFQSPETYNFNELEKMKLLRLVWGLLDRRDTHKGKERVLSSDEETFHASNYSRHHGSSWDTRMAISVEDGNRNGRLQLGHSCSHCGPYEQRWSVELFPPWGCCDRRPRGLADHTLTNPLLWRHSAHSADQRVPKQCPQKQHLLPVASGAPFIACHFCFEVLQLPADFLAIPRRCHMLRCGACSKVVTFSLGNRTRLAPLEQKLTAGPQVNHMSSASASYGYGCPNGDPVSISDDNGPSLVLSESASESLEKPSVKSRAGEISSEIVEVRRTNSPLHRLMGYSSPSEVMSARGRKKSSC